MSIRLAAWRVPGGRGDVLRPAPWWAAASARPLLPRYLVLQLGGGGLLVTVSEGQPLPQGRQLLLQLGFVLLQPGHGLHHPMHHGGRTRRPRQARAPPAAKGTPTYEQSSGRSAGQQRPTLAEERRRPGRPTAPSHHRGQGGMLAEGMGQGEARAAAWGSWGTSAGSFRGTDLPGSGLRKATFTEYALQSMGSRSDG